MYVIAGSKGTTALFLLDKAARAPRKEPLLRIDGFDFGGSLVADPAARKVVGVHFVSDAPTSYWFDPEMRKAQAKIDAQLPATANRISCRRCLSSPHLLVFAGSDRDPGTFYLYDVKAGTLERIARVRPWIEHPERPARRLQGLRHAGPRIEPRAGKSVRTNDSSAAGCASSSAKRS